MGSYINKESIQAKPDGLPPCEISNMTHDTIPERSYEECYCRVGSTLVTIYTIVIVV